MFVLTTVDRFQAAYDIARKTPLVEAMTSPLEHTESTDYFLSGDTLSGFAIRRPDDDSAELVYVFSLERGRGRLIVESAIANGALRLDCFDGYLVKLYGSLGFREYNREANWTPGEPDVVYMSLRVSVWREKRYPLIRSLSA